MKKLIIIMFLGIFFISFVSAGTLANFVENFTGTSLNTTRWTNGTGGVGNTTFAISSNSFLIYGTGIDPNGVNDTVYIYSNDVINLSKDFNITVNFTIQNTSSTIIDTTSAYIDITIYNEDGGPGASCELGFMNDSGGSGYGWYMYAGNTSSDYDVLIPIPGAVGTSVTGKFSMIWNQTSQNLSCFFGSNIVSLISAGLSTSVTDPRLQLDGGVSCQGGLINASFSNLVFHVGNYAVPSLVAFASPGITVFQNRSINNIPVNISVADDYMIGTVNISLFNSSRNLINSSWSFVPSIGTGSYFFNFTGLSDGVYYVNATVNDSSNNRNFSSTLSVTIDTAVPSLAAFVAPGLTVSYTNLSQTSFPVNISLADSTGLNFVKVFLYNSAYTLLNTTNKSFTGQTSSSYFVNWTSLADGIYYANATVNDSAGNTNYTSNFRVTLDNTAPTVSLSKTSSSTTSLTIKITVNDPMSGIAAKCTVDRTTATVSGTATLGEMTDQSITESGLSCGSSYSYTATCADRAGNSRSTAATSFSTDACGGGSGGGGGGGGSSSSTWTATYIPSSAELSSGYSKDLAVNNRVSLKVEGITHSVGVISLTSTTATVQIASNPVDVKLAVGQDAKVDVNNDGFYDVYVKLNSIAGNKANVLVQTIHEAVPAEKAGEVLETTGEDVTPEEVPESEEVKASLTWIWWVAGIVAVVIIVLIIVLSRKKKKK
jgi:hypothetical protein